MSLINLDIIRQEVRNIIGGQVVFVNPKEFTPEVLKNLVKMYELNKVTFVGDIVELAHSKTNLEDNWIYEVRISCNEDLDCIDEDKSFFVNIIIEFKEDDEGGYQRSYQSTKMNKNLSYLNDWKDQGGVKTKVEQTPEQAKQSLIWMP